MPIDIAAYSSAIARLPAAQANADASSQRAAQAQQGVADHPGDQAFVWASQSAAQQAATDAATLAQIQAIVASPPQLPLPTSPPQPPVPSGPSPSLAADALATIRAQQATARVQQALAPPSGFSTQAPQGAPSGLVSMIKSLPPVAKLTLVGLAAFAAIKILK